MAATGCVFLTELDLSVVVTWGDRGAIWGQFGWA